MKHHVQTTAGDFGEDELRQAAHMVGQAILDALPDPTECRHIFSPEFQTQMAPLLTRSKRMEVRRRWIGRAAAVLVAAAVGTASWLTVDTRAQSALFQWVREVYENSIVYHFFNDSHAAQGLSVYRPSWIPEGYQQTDVMVTDTVHTVVYQKGQDPQDGFLLDYYRYSEDSYLELWWGETEYECVELQVNGMPAQFYRSLDRTQTNDLVWLDEAAQILFTLNGKLDQDVMLHIAESIKLVNETKIKMNP